LNTAAAICQFGQSVAHIALGLTIQSFVTLGQSTRVLVTHSQRACRWHRSSSTTVVNQAK